MIFLRPTTTGVVWRCVGERGLANEKVKEQRILREEQGEGRGCGAVDAPIRKDRKNQSLVRGYPARPLRDVTLERPWLTFKDVAEQLATEWQDTKQDPQTIPGVRTQILTQFHPVTQDEYNAKKT